VTFPSPTDELFANAFSAGLGAMTPDVTSTMSVPVAIGVDAMNQVFRAAVNRDPGAAVVGVATNVITEVAQMASKLGGLGSFVSGSGGAASPAMTEMAQMLGGVLDVIPMLGQVVMEMISVLDAYEAQQEQLARQRQIQAATNCANEQRADQPLPTGPGGETTPADMFRDVAEASGSQRQGMPMSSALGFVLLCGGQTRGGVFEFPSYPPLKAGAPRGEAGYQAWLADARRAFGPSIGIPKHIRRKMWLLIEGIMAARRPSTLERVEPLGDQGRILFPMLVDLMLYEGQTRRSWNAASVQSLYRVFSTTCGKYIDLGTVFERTILDWKHTVQPVSKTDWIAKAERDAAQAKSMTLAGGVIEFNPAEAKALVEGAKARQEQAAPPLGPMQGLALGTGMLGMGYGAWTLMRRFGPKKA
jgi:hypothetical protein